MFKFIAALMAFVTVSEAARILCVFPIPSISHQVVFRPLTQELAKNGHEVVVVTPDPAFPKGQTPANLTEIDTHDISYSIWSQLFKLTSGRKNDAAEQMVTVYRVQHEVFEAIINMDEVKNLFKQEFDLLFLESCVRPALTLTYVFKVPVILVSSLGATDYNIDTIGAAGHPLLYPSYFRKRVYNLTYWEKITEVWKNYKLNRGLETVELLEDEMAKRNFGPDIPSISELKNNVDMLFLNLHPIWDSNRPVPPSVVYIGSLHQNPAKELPQDLKKYLDSSKNGVIYISFGTNVKPSLLPAEKLTIILKVLSQSCYDVLWKWDKDELPGRTDNIKISKWLPQSDLLRHPKIKLFITQGGLQSTDEAIKAGVPLLGIPMFADQWFNIEQYKYHKIGMRIDIETLTEDQLREAINTIIDDASYRNNVVRLRGLMLDQPQRPLERAVWWTEHVLRHGGAPHLRAPAANMTWPEYLELEIVLIVLLVVMTVIASLIISLYYLCSKLNSYYSSVKVKRA